MKTTDEPVAPGQAEPARGLTDLTPEQRALLMLRLRQKAARQEEAQGPVLRPLPRGTQGAQEDGSAVFPLSFAQQRLWFVDQWQPRNPAYNIALAIRAEGRLNREALRSSFDEIVRRQESLRTGFQVQSEQPVQVIRPAEPLAVPEVDLAALPEEARTAEARRLAEESSLTPFDLGRDRLLRVTLLRLGADDHAVLICMHHIVSDGWSISILVQEFVTLYTAQVEGRPAPLPPLEVQYPDFAVWQREWLRTEALEAQLDYWRRTLAGIPEAIELPLSHPRPAVRTARGRRASYIFPGELTAPLKTLAQQEGATLFMVLLAAFQTLLHRYSGERDIVVGTPVAGRNRAELERVIGFFVNNLVLRGDLSGDPTFRELAGRVRESTVGAQSHADVPFERLVEELRPERDLSRPPLYQVVFTMQNTPDNTVVLPDLSLETLPFDPGTAKNDLLLSVAEGQDGWAGGFLEYSLDLFDAAAAHRILGHYRALLQGIGEDPERALSALPLLAEAERWQLLGEWNDTAAELPVGSFRQLWETRAERWAELPAVASAVTGESLTYRELDRRANLLAEYLRTLGVGPEVLVGVLMERSVEVVVAMLAVWKAGGVYVPLDPSYPEERLAAMLEDTSLAIVLTQEALASRLPWSAGFVVAVDAEWDRIALGAFGSGEPFDSGVESENLAYVIFTSGSTGRPKGVMVQYGGFNVLGFAQERQFGPGGGERLLLFAPLAFDTAIFDWMLALWRGNTLYLTGPEELLPGPALVRLLEREGITSLTMTPSALSALPVEELPALNRLWVAGEACTPELVQRWRTPERVFYNGYGPTEITIWATTETCDDSGRVPPIGRPAANKRTYVLNERSQPVPVGGVGELYVGGAGLARGYLHRPDLTAERFVPDPISGEPGARLYRTGDLVRQAADGKLLFVGRNDHQVKIRGFRIELGEIEAVLGRHPAVRDAAVIVREENGDKRLAAYFVARDGSELPADELRAYLRERLPDFMLPATFTALEALPLTPNDKLDRRALAGIDPAAAKSAQDFLAPRNPVEDLLALILAEVLGLERVGVRDSFFDLGGHSLLATQVLSRVREAFGVEVALASFFEQPTVEGLAARVQGGTAVAGTPLEARPRQADDPLSFAQQRLWFLQQLDPGSAAYNIPGAVRLSGKLDAADTADTADIAALARSLSEIVRRHEVLRTSFPEEAGRPVQLVAPWRPEPLPVVVVAHLPEEAREGEIRRLGGEMARQPFDLGEGPLLRLALVEAGQDDHVLLYAMHHIVSDGWSMGLLIGELARLYRAFQAGEPSPLPDLPVQYADFARWQREWLQGGVLESQLAYWRQRLAGVPPVLALPTDRPRPAVAGLHGAGVGIALDAELVAALESLSRRRGATLFMTLLAGLQILLARLAGQRDFCVGTPIAGRNRLEVEGLIGFFVNTLVLRSDLADSLAAGDLLAQVRATALGAYAHQDLPFEQLVEEVQPERDLAGTPLFQVMFALQNAPSQALDLPGLTLAPVPVEMGSAKFDLDLQAVEAGGGLGLWAVYRTDLFDGATVSRWLGHFRTVLRGIAADPEKDVFELPLLSPAEREQILVEWNRTAAEFPRESMLHELFVEQAGIRPDAVAVECGDLQWTYRELRERAGRLARHLRALGVGADGDETRVGLLTVRSASTAAGLLGILEAGGAYLPLEPAHPAERVEYLLRDAGADVLLADRRLVEGAGAPHARSGAQRRVVYLDDETGWEPQSEIEPWDDSRRLAYVTYTSGSTGRPKGVAISHRNVLRLVRSAEGGFAHAELGPDRTFLQFAPVAFDASTLEIWGPLLTGGRLVLYPGDKASLEELGAAIARHRVDSLWLTSGLFQQMVDHQLESLRPLKQLLAGGDVVSAPHARRVLEELPGTVMVNGYGPTEGTTFLCGYRMTDPAQVGLSTPIGGPIANTTAYVLDRELRPVLIGVVGELCAGGEGLARGYHDRPALTAEKFVPDPFGGPGERLYRTGDLVRWRPDGLLEFLGRDDGQVKIRGFRVEPGEVEAALNEHPAVYQAAVSVAEGAGGKTLAAFVVPAAQEGDDLVAQLKASLRTWLPEAMVPTAWTVLDTLPLLSNGKLDRRALAALAAEGADLPARVATDIPGADVSDDPVAGVVAAIWCEILGLDRVGLHESFFDLGGHSLLATQVISRVRAALGVELPLRTLFESPTVAALAGVIGGLLRARGGVTAPPLVPLGREGALPLSFAQERLWFVERLQPDTPTYNIPLAVDFRGPLDPAALESALLAVIARHEALRTRLPVTEEGIPFQQIEPEPDRILPLVDLSALPGEVRDVHAAALANEAAARPFPLESDLPLRALLVRRSERDHLALITLHHIAADAWSVGVLVREVSALYRAATGGGRPDLPALPVQYADFAAWQRTWLQGELLAEQLAYWRARLAGAPAVADLPLDRPRPALHTFRGSHRTARLGGPELAAALKALGRRSGATLFMTLLAAFYALLHRLTGATDLVVGSPNANRNRTEIEGLIGLFVNSLVLRADLSGDPPFERLLARVREGSLEAFVHQDLPFEKLVAELAPERDLSHTPLFQILVQLENTPPARLDLGADLELALAPVESRTAKFDLVLNFRESEAGLWGTWIFNTDLFESATVLRLTGQLGRLLEGVAAAPGAHLSDLPLLTPSERQQAVLEWNDTASAGGEGPGFLDLFAARVQAAPEAPAVSCGGRTLSYAELAGEAERMAAALAGRGLGPESLVAIVGERGPDLLVSLLAVQRCGAAWLPLDPAQPEARNERILAESRADLLLVLPGGEALAGRPGAVSLGDLPAGPRGPLRRSFPQNLAYAIYTSGSTGTPKGALVENRGMLNHLWAKIEDLGLTAADAVAQTASAAFDISVWQFLAALVIGGRVVVLPDEIAHDPGRLLDRVEAEGITVLETVPSLLGGMLDLLEESERRPSLAALRWMIPTGEALPPALARRWLALYPGIPLLNAYGPTECSDDVSHFRLAGPPARGAAAVSVGRPVRNLRLHVVGDLGAGLPPLPIGAVGELAVSGTGVGRGYRDDPRRTAEVFVPDPFAAVWGEPGSRLYRTGDLARLLPDGTVDFLGRRDHQVKVRGFRIEIGEIEAALLDQPAIREAVVAVRGEGGAKRLAAYVVPRDEQAGQDLASELRAALSERLPEAMVPADWVLLPALPLTPNGKVDRRALPDPQGGTAAAVYVAPGTPLESLIAELWTEVLGPVRFGIHDSFFDLGGDSIKGAVFVHRLQRRLQSVLYVATLFDRPTIAGLAVYLSEHYADAVARLEGAEEGGLLPGPRSRLTGGDLERFRALIPPLPEPPRASAGKNPPAVFLLSPPRAGSTLLRVLLAGHPQLFAPPELELLSFHTLAERRDAFTGRNRFWLEGALRALVQIHGWSPEEAAERMAEYERQGLSTRQFYRLIQEWIGDQMLVDKTPSYALDPAVLRQAEEGFEGARYIHLVRHPSASILSFEEARLDQVFFRHPHSYPPRQLAELIWTVSQENILGFLAGVPAERQHRVVFEDLVAEPRPVLEGICAFLGLPYHPDMEHPYADSRSRMTDGLHEVSRMLGDVKFHEHREVDPAAAQRWRFQVSEDDLGGPTREVASRLGYDLAPLPEEEPEDSRLSPLAQRGEAPVLSFAQERLWFLHQLDPEGATYNMPQAFRLVGPLDEAALQAAFREVLRRHEMLRTRFAVDEGRPVPVVAQMASLPERVLLLVDLAALGAGAGEEGRRLAREEALRPFDLEHGPVVRGLLMRLGPQDRVVVFVSHHIACDGWSMGLWAREIETLYTAFSEGRPSPLPDPPAQYADFAAWQRSWLQGSMLESQLAYWRERLRSAPAVLEIPLDRPRPALRTSRGEAESRFVAPELAERLRALSGRHNASLFMTLLAVFQLHLSRLSGQEDILVGSPITGRTRPEAEELIGCFLNTLALRTDLSGGPDFLELLRRVRETALGAFSYQDVPFEKLLEELRPERDTSRPSLFQVLFNMLNAPRAEIDLPGLTLAPLAASEPFAKFDLTLYVLEQGGGLRLELVYNADLFDRARMAEMLRQYQLLLEQIAERPEAPVAAHSLLTREAAAVLPDPAASLVHPWPGAVQDLFAAWARRTPEKVALSDRDGDWTYGELDNAVKRLAARLGADGIRPGDRVAIYAHRSAALAWALLGVLKAGAVFTILDPIYPAPRLIDRLNMAEPRGLLHLEAAGPLAPELAAYVEAQEYPCRFVLPAGSRERATAPVVGQSLPDSWPGMGPYDVASIAFTSGSTGLPKGIVQTHGSMSYFLPWHQEELGFTADDRHTMLSGLAHDPLHRDTFYCLGTGATLYVPDPDRIGQPGYLAGWMKDRRVTITNMTPAMGKLLVELPVGAPVPELPDLRVAILAGDLLTREVVAQIRRLAPRAVFLNVYGATESQRALSYHVVEEERGRRLKQTLPLGKGKKGSQLLVLTAAGLRAGIGELGEVVIRSPHLAQGYLKDEAQTEAKYGTNPFTGEPGDRIYRTGDLGRYLPDGDVEAAGRADQQVKIRGFRVEPGEVEAELLRAPGVKETVVVARSVATDGERQLVAYLVLDPHALAEISDLRERLRQNLPAYMVPAAWVILEKLPVNPNGKIDRLALPSPEAAALGSERRAVPPRDDLERRLAGIWEEVLGTAPVGVTDDFFDLGGHSLMAVRLMARIEAEMGRTLPLSALFQTGTVEGLAALLRRSEPREASPLVTLRAGGSKPPLFLVHPLGGQVLAYAGLVRLLDPERPVYGLQDVAPPGSGRTIAGLAAAYVEQVRSVQPEGPYHLAGWSLGGRIAFEMASQLAAQGQETAFLGLIDTGLVAPPERPDQKDGAVLLREILWAVPSEVLEDLRPGLEDPLGVLLERLGEAGQLPAGFNPEIARRHFQVLQEHLDIARRYRPQPFAGRLTFFAAEEQPSLGDGIALDPTHGWGAFATETDLLRVPGDHVSMMHDPAHLQVLAETLNASLERAENS